MVFYFSQLLSDPKRTPRPQAPKLRVEQKLPRHWPSKVTLGVCTATLPSARAVSWEAGEGLGVY